MFREMLNKICHEEESGMIELSQLIKSKNINIFDLGNISKYQLSMYKDKSRRYSMDKIQHIGLELNHIEQSHHNSSYINFDQLYNFILRSVPNSKIVVIGGSDDICRSVYETNTPSSLQ